MGKIGHWVALNESDEGTGRDPQTLLEVHTVTNWNLASWKFADSMFRNWATGWYQWSPHDYHNMSLWLNKVLRRLGCTEGRFLGCDSGGWFHLDHIAEILCSGVTEQEPGARIWRPNWVHDLRDK